MTRFKYFVRRKEILILVFLSASAVLITQHFYDNIRELGESMPQATGRVMMG